MALRRQIKMELFIILGTKKTNGDKFSNGLEKNLIRSVDGGMLWIHDVSYFDPAKRFMEKYHDSDLSFYAGLHPFGMFNAIYSMPIMDVVIALDENLKLIDAIECELRGWTMTAESC
jgi:hypothetical protein